MTGDDRNERAAPPPSAIEDTSATLDLKMKIDSEATIDHLATVDPLESFDPDMSGFMETLVPTSADQTHQPNPPLSADVTLTEDQRSRIAEICRRFESDWQVGDREPDIAKYVPADVEPGLRDSLIRELVIVDVLCRKQRDKSLPPTDYLSRFPNCRSAVQSALTERKSTVPQGYGSLTVPARAKDRMNRLTHADDSLSRYRPTKFHARGGLGAVFRAQDEELNRVVALKEILPEHGESDRVKEKFVFEAEVTGSLEHPGIVPVYGLGHYEDQQPYYAMRFIHGKSFRKVIEAFHKEHPTPTRDDFYSRDFRTLLRRFIDSCNAIHYAHEHGVLHRDIKPDNIMIGDYGETLVVDWGLAKLVQSEDPRQESAMGSRPIKTTSSGTSTSQGSALGTPMFMSPEQAFGRHDELDRRTDVYSLGAMLFNMVTGKYPIDGKSARDIVLNVRQGRTRSLTDVSPNAPRAIASICEKAMQSQPADRYSTAIELSDDLDRWMNDDQVLAHIGHETSIERLGRLIRRYRSWTISGAAAMLTVTLVAIGSALLINNAKKNEESAKLQAQEFKYDAVARYRVSRDAIDTWLVQSSDALESFPGTQAVRSRLLEIATDDYTELAKLDSRDPELELERGRVLAKLGDLHRFQNQFDEARDSYQQAMALFEIQPQVDSEDALTQQRDDRNNEPLITQLQAEHGYLHNRMGQLLAQEGRAAMAEQEFKLGIAELSSLIENVEGATLAKRLLAATRINLGSMYQGLGRSDDAIEQLDRGLASYLQLQQIGEPGNVLSIARARELLGRIYLKLGKHDEATDYFDDAIADLSAEVVSKPDHLESLDALASAHVSAATSYRQRGLQTPLFEALDSAVKSYRALETAMPEMPQYVENLSLTLTDLAIAQHEAGQNQQAQEKLDEANERLSQLVRSHGQVPRYRDRLAACQDALGQVYLDVADDPTKATTMLARGMTTYQSLIQLDGRPEYFERLAIAQSHYAQALARQGEFETAEQHFGGALSTLQQLMELQSPLPSYVSAIAHVHQRFAEMLHQQGDERSESHFRDAVARWTELDQPTASHCYRLAFLLATCQDASIRDPKESLRFANLATELAPSNPNHLSMQGLATLLDDPSPAVAKEVIALLDECKSERGEWIDQDWFVVAIAHHHMGNAEQAESSLDSGSKWMNENRPHNADARNSRQLALATIRQAAK